MHHTVTWQSIVKLIIYLYGCKAQSHTCILHAFHFESYSHNDFYTWDAKCMLCAYQLIRGQTSADKHLQHETELWTIIVKSKQ